MILGLDTATKTGFCLLKKGNVYESGVQDFSKRRGESNGMLFLHFRAWLSKILDENDVKLCLFEQAHHRGGAATELGVGLVTRVQELCAERSIDYAGVHTGTLKKAATGRGNAEKADMMREAKLILGREPLDDNEADAICLAYYGMQEYGIQ